METIKETTKRKLRTKLMISLSYLIVVGQLAYSIYQEGMYEKILKSTDMWLGMGTYYTLFWIIIAVFCFWFFATLCDISHYFTLMDNGEIHSKISKQAKDWSNSLTALLCSLFSVLAFIFFLSYAPIIEDKIFWTSLILWLPLTAILQYIADPGSIFRLEKVTLDRKTAMPWHQSGKKFVKLYCLVPKDANKEWIDYTVKKFLQVQQSEQEEILEISKRVSA